MTSKGSLTSACQISITARSPVYPLHPLPSTLLNLPSSPDYYRLCPFYLSLRATIFDHTRNASTIHHLSIGWFRANLRALFIDSLWLVHFMIDYYDCSCKLISWDITRCSFIEEFHRESTLIWKRNRFGAHIHFYINFLHYFSIGIYDLKILAKIFAKILAKLQLFCTFQYICNL